MHVWHEGAFARAVGWNSDRMNEVIRDAAMTMGVDGAIEFIRNAEDMGVNAGIARPRRAEFHQIKEGRVIHREPIAIGVQEVTVS